MPDLDIVARLKLAGEAFSKEFDDRMRRMEDSAKSYTSRTNALLGGIGKGVAALGAGVGLAAIGAAAQRALDYASSLGEVSQQLGVTTRDLQVYRFEATQVGIEQEVMDRALAKLTVTLGKAALGAKQPLEAFNALGVSVRDTDGHVRDAGQAIPLIAEALSKITDPARRAAIEVELFGKAGQKLDTLLAGGRGQIDSLAASAQRLGIVLSDKQIQDADDAADKLAALKQVLEANIAGAVANNAAAILKFAEAAEHLISIVPRAVGALGRFRSALNVGEGYGHAGFSMLVGNQAGVVEGLELARRSQADIKKSLYDRDLAGIDKAMGAILHPTSSVPRAANDDIPAFLGAATKGHRALSDAQREQAKAAREAAAEQRDLERDLQSLTARYDPATAAAEEYARAIETIRRGEADGLRTADQAQTLRVGVMKDRWDAEGRAQAEYIKNPLKEWGADTADVFRKNIDKLYASADDFRDKMGDAGDNFGRHAQDSMRYVLYDLQNAVSSLFGRRGYGNSPVLNALTMGEDIDFLRRSIGDMVDRLDKTFGKLPAGLEKAVRGGLAAAIEGASVGSSIGSRFGKNGDKIGGAAGAGIGAILGDKRLASLSPYIAAYQAGQAIDDIIGPAIAKAVGAKYSKTGQALGGLVGGFVGGLFKSWPSGGATITGLTGSPTTFGKSSISSVASGSASSVQEALQQIAQGLGASLGAFSPITIGQYGKNGEWRLNTMGGSTLGGSKNAIPGVQYFGSGDAGQQQAIYAAIALELSRGVITGLSAASQRLLANAGEDLGNAVTKAVMIESIPKELKAALDPVGAAIDAVNEKWAKTVAALEEGGASAQQMAQAQQLYKIQLDQVKASTASASQTLKDFRDGLMVGGSSPYSLRDQEAQARSKLNPYLDTINAGGSVDQQKYQAAAQAFLDIERQLYGSTQQYFDALDAVQASTNKAIALIDNAVPIGGASADPFAKAAADAAARTAANTQTGNELLNQVSATLENVELLLTQMAYGRGGASGEFIGQARGFQR